MNIKIGKSIMINTNIGKFKDEIDNVIYKIFDFFKYYFTNFSPRLNNEDYNYLMFHSIETLLYSNLTIEFSSKTPFKEYNGVSIKEIIKTIDDLIKDENVPDYLIEILNRLKRILKSEQRINRRLSETLEELENITEELEGQLSNISKKIKEVINKTMNRKVRFSILGQYFHSLNAPRIVLYCNNIPDDFEYYERVFAHELFHAIHYHYVNLYSGSIGDFKEKKITIESLASFFEYIYCKEEICNSIFADDLLNTWLVYSENVYPYAGAKHIYAAPDPRKTFGLLFDMSVTDDYISYLDHDCQLEEELFDRFIDDLKKENLSTSSINAYVKAIKEVLDILNISMQRIWFGNEYIDDLIPYDIRKKYGSFFDSKKDLIENIESLFGSTGRYSHLHSKQHGYFTAPLKHLEDFFNTLEFSWYV